MRYKELCSGLYPRGTAQFFVQSREKIQLEKKKRRSNWTDSPANSNKRCNSRVVQYVPY